jgi:CheY-like chemotaxis protein
METLRRRLVLVADDNRDLADSLSLLLKLVGFDVETVHNGNDALSVARSRKPDVVLLDIGLPGLNGFEVAEKLRRDEAFKSVLMIAASGYAPGTVGNSFQHAQFDHYFTKPVDFSTLLPLLT